MELKEFKVKLRPFLCLAVNRTLMELKDGKDTSPGFPDDC